MKEELQKLHRELELIKSDVNERIANLEQKIKLLEASSSESMMEEAPVQSAAAEMTGVEIEFPVPVIPPMSPETMKVVSEKYDIPKTNEAAFRVAGHEDSPVVQETVSAVSAPREDAPKKQKEFGALMAEIFAPLLAGPVGTLLSKARDLYTHYKDQGKLPILFLTVAGIITLVLGFGFMLQYSFANLLTESAKVSLGFLASLAVIAVGVRVIHIKDAYREYGSSLVGLGTILVYLCIYFAASFYRFVPASVGFALICMNTVVAYYLALRYETRIVSVISFLGGALVPFVLASYGRSEVFYFSFLLILCASTIHLGRKIRWSSLVYISFLTAAAVIEYTIFALGTRHEGVFLTILIHGFSYIYLYYALFDRTAFRKTVKTDEVLILAGAVSLLLINLFQIYDSPEIPGYMYAANSLPFLIMALLPFLKPEPRLRTILLLVAGVFTGLAVPAVFSFKVMALFWIQEAFLLLLLGFIYKLVSVRREAFVVAIIAVVQSALNMPVIGEMWDSHYLQWVFNEGTMNLMALGVILFLFSWCLWKYKDRLDSFEKRGRRIINESISLWSFSVFLLTAFYFVPDYGAACAVIAMPLLFVRAEKKMMPFTRFLGFAAYGFLLLQVLLSISALTVMVPEIYRNWSPGVFLDILLNVVIVGVVLILSNVTFIRLKEAIGPSELKTKRFNNELISAWALGAYLLGIFYLLPDYALLLALVPMPFLFIRGTRKELSLTRVMAYGCYVLFLGFIIFSIAFIKDSMAPLDESVKTVLLNPGTIRVVLLGAVLGTVIVLLNIIRESVQPAGAALVRLHNELFSAWILGAFLFAAYYIHAPFMFGLAIIPMPFLLVRAYRVNLPITLMMAFGCYILILVQLALAIESAGTFSFSMLSIYGKISSLEAFLLLWALQWFFEWQMPDSKLVKYMRMARVFFYLALPVIFLPHVARFHPDFLPLAVWGSVAAAVILREIVTIDIIRMEVHFLAIAASLYTFLALLAQTGSPGTWHPAAGAAAGVVILMGITVWKGGLRDGAGNDFSLLFNTAFIFPGAAAFALTVFLTGSVNQGLLVSGSYGLIVLLLRRFLPPVMKRRTAFYRTGQVFIVLGLVLDLIEGGRFPHMPLSAALGISIPAFLILSYVTYGDKGIFQEMSGGNDTRRENIFLADVYVFHVVVMGLYMTIIEKVTAMWMGPATTVMLVAHAIVIMFYGTIKNYKKLIPFYVTLFVLSAAKIIFYDLRDFSLFEKILAFTAIGVVMLGAAYGMQRFISRDQT